MSTTAAAPPVIPPRPSRGLDKDAIPQIPPRPINKRIERSVSPGGDRFAPSPLNESPFPKSPRSTRFSPASNGHQIRRPPSVDMPSLGQEGQEYAQLAQETDETAEQSSNPELTRTVGEDIKLHAPKPSLPAASAKQRVMAVTRTDSDRAASFGIGKPSIEDASAPPSNRSLKKKASTVSQLSTSESHVDDEQGIPEIGQQVPMYPNAGDVQAPSPAPGATFPDSVKQPASRNHNRRTSARGGQLPPGSYGLHGHGLAPQDKLDKVYYEKHPELLKKEHTPHHYDRPHDYSMSSEELNKIVRETASRSSGPASKSTPSDQVGWQALEESSSRVASPRPGSTEQKPDTPNLRSSLKQEIRPDISVSDADESGEIIHVEEPHNRRRSVMFSDEESPNEDEERSYTAPILAEDEVAKDPSPYDFQPAIEPGPERRGSAYEIEEPTSRPTSRPASIYKEAPFEVRSTPLEDVEEYEPLFPDDEAKAAAAKKAAASQQKSSKLPQGVKHRFPSADIWEDAPNSVHFTAEVSTPEPTEEQMTAARAIPPPRDGETPVQAFARHQEELAEKAVREGGHDTFIPTKNQPKPTWAQHQSHLASEVRAVSSSSSSERPSMAQRFPSRDIWEDTPDSLKLETTVSTPQLEESGSPADTKPEIPQRPVRQTASPSNDKPAIPERPRKQSSGDGSVTSPLSGASSVKSPPSIPERPKPNVPPRPAKAGPTSGGLEPADAAAPPPKTKPAVPARPMGSKIAALQAGFMSDLNNRLKLGPQAPKKEEPPAAAEENLAEVKEKAPLADARKGRARGPQRRAPAKSASPAPAAAADEKAPVALSFSTTYTLFDIDPEAGVVSVPESGASSKEPAPAISETKREAEPAEADDEEVETKEVSKGPAAAVETHEPPKHTKSEEAAPAEPEELKPEAEETKSLATNTAGEPLIEETLKTDSKTGETEDVEVEEH